MITGSSHGRFDVLGGIADYSGSSVVLLPTDEVAKASMSPGGNKVSASTTNADGDWDDFAISLDLLRTMDQDALATHLSENRRFFWAAHVIGVAKIFSDAGFQVPGCHIEIDSSVPIGAGLASSAAIETATGKCFAEFFGMPNDQIPKICQTAENRIALAPSGIMDHAVATHGIRDRLFFMRCDPLSIIDQLRMPKQISVLGIYSGVKHSVAGRQYGRARASAFIGKTLLGIEGYLCSQELSEAEIGCLPSEVLGKDFLRTHESHEDKATKLRKEEIYLPRDAVKHAINENKRVEEILENLRNRRKPDFSSMFDSHREYSEIGLGSEQTDLLVELLEKKDSVLGARVSGGGCGGTVVVVCSEGWQDELNGVLELYAGITKLTPKLFQQSY
jgi:galactokinase